jgi:antitoxin ParD1/3/4
MRQALRLLIEREQERHAKLAALRNAIREGEDSGEAEEWDVEQFLAEEP